MSLFSDYTKSALSVLLNVCGEMVIYRPLAGGVCAVRGVFDANHTSIEIHDGATYSTVAPVLGIRLSDFGSSPVQGDRFEIQNVPYDVTNVKPDGQGAAELTLRRV